MSVASRRDGTKWIQASVAITCMLVGYVLLSFFSQIGEWFELESKIAYFNVSYQLAAIVISLGIFVYIIRNEKTYSFLKEVYQETIKVIWPDKNQTVRHTVGIMIAVGIVGFILGVFDFIANYLLSLIR